MRNFFKKRTGEWKCFILWLAIPNSIKIICIQVVTLLFGWIIIEYSCYFGKLNLPFHDENLEFFVWRIVSLMLKSFVIKFFNIYENDNSNGEKIFFKEMRNNEKKKATFWVWMSSFAWLDPLGFFAKVLKKMSTPLRKLSWKKPEFNLWHFPWIQKHLIKIWEWNFRV